MSDMLSFSRYMLEAIADFLGSPPLIYLFGLIFLSCAVRWIYKLIKS